MEPAKPPNIVLVGFTSSGKTSIGKYLAERLLWDFYDIDTLVVSAVGTHQDAFIEQYGWERFRDKEFEILSTLPSSRSVISTGGGTLLDSRSRELLSSGIIIHLEASEEKLRERIGKRTDRPLARSWSMEEISQKLGERQIFYNLAPIRINTNGPINQAAENVFTAINRLGLGTCFEFWFRNEYASLIRNRELTCFLRPDNRRFPHPKGIPVGERVRMRILNHPSTSETLPSLSEYYAYAEVTSIQVKRIRELTEENLAGSSPDAFSQRQVPGHLGAIYGRVFDPEDTVTVFKVAYEPPDFVANN